MLVIGDNYVSRQVQQRLNTSLRNTIRTYSSRGKRWLLIIIRGRISCTWELCSFRRNLFAETEQLFFKLGSRNQILFKIHSAETLAVFLFFIYIYEYLIPEIEESYVRGTRFFSNIRIEEILWRARRKYSSRGIKRPENRNLRKEKCSEDCSPGMLARFSRTVIYLCSVFSK